MEDGVTILEGAGHRGPISERKAQADAVATREVAREGPGAPEGNRNAAKDNGDKSENHNHCFERGTSATYRIRKLRRDCPEAAQKLERGEFKSVAAAERWARGEEPHPPRKLPSPLDVLRRAWAKASAAQRRAFLKEVVSE
jgi:hypothetical protein